MLGARLCDWLLLGKDWCFILLNDSSALILEMDCCMYETPLSRFRGRPVINRWNDIISAGYEWVSWCLQPSQPQRITSGLNTTLSHSFHKSCFWAYIFYPTGTPHRNLHPAGWPILFCGPTQEPRASNSQHRRNRERFWKKCRWMDRKGRNKQGRNPWQ